VEAHPFRIDTTDGIGHPTPGDAYRDEVDLVAVFLVERHGVKSGETRVFDVNEPHGQRFTLIQAWSALLLNLKKLKLSVETGQLYRVAKTNSAIA
jgi:hypothetical protein